MPKNSGIMQPCKSNFHPIQGVYLIWGWHVTNGDKWSYKLTYFSFWEGLLWPASALNCALDPESKGKDKQTKIRETAERVRQEKSGQQPKQRTVFKALCVKMTKKCGVWKFGTLLTIAYSWWELQVLLETGCQSITGHRHFSTTNSTQKSPGWESNPWPSCCEAMALSSAQLCHPPNKSIP